LGARPGCGSGTPSGCDSYARNYRLEFTIPYEFAGQTHTYTPDFIVKLRRNDGSLIHIVLEVKGFEDNRDRAKEAAAHRWVDAVNNWGQMGLWAFHEVKDLTETERILTQFAEGMR
jgi:type III restriction enzyme